MLQDTNTQSSRGTRYPGLAIFQETAVQHLIKPLGQELRSQVPVEPWHKTKLLLMGSSGGKDEHTERAEGCPSEGLLCMQVAGGRFHRGRGFGVVWLDNVARDSQGRCVWPGERRSGRCRCPG